MYVYFSWRRLAALLLTAGLLTGISFGVKYYKRCTILPTTYPFISANDFRHITQHHFDHPVKLPIIFTGRSFDPKTVRDGDIIFIKSNHYYLKRFFANVHPHITARYAILSHNGDESVPGSYESYLNDPKILAWFGCNVAQPQHPKMVSIPLGVLGILNKYLPPKVHEVWTRLKLDIANGTLKKTGLVFFNITVGTNRAVRQPVYDFFAQQSFCKSATKKPYEQFLREMATFKFVISPFGTGLDCYRTWEALALGCIPIVQTSPLDCLYEGLPVLIVDEWSQVTEAFLNQKYEQMRQQQYNLDALSIDYWIRLIRARLDKELSTPTKS